MFIRTLFFGAALTLPLLATASPADLSLVKDIGTAPSAWGSAPGAFRRIGDLVYFNANTPLLGTELYATDGVSAQPQLVQDFAAGPASSYPRAVGMAGGRLIVEADDALQGNQLLALDRATGARTPLQVFGGSGGAAFPTVTPIAQVGSHLLFSAVGQVYTTDGTLAGTTPLTSWTIYPPTLSASVCSLPGGGAVFVSAPDGGVQTLWRTDGPRASNRAIATFPQESHVIGTAAGGNGCYLLFARGSGWSLWRTDGNGATIAALQSNARAYGVVAGATVAYVDDEVVGSQIRLWRTDLAQPLYSHAAGNNSWVNRTPRVVGNRIVFNAPYLDGSVQRMAIHIGDGTTAGSVRVSPANGLETLDSRDTAINGTNLLLSQGGSLWVIDTLQRTVHRAGDGFAGDVVELGGALVGASRSDAVGEEVFRSDGTTAPLLLHDIRQGNVGALSGYGFDAVAIGDTLYFGHVVDATMGWGSRMGLWRTDGSEAGTQPLSRDLYGTGSVSSIVRAGSGIVFNTGPQSLTPVFYTNADFTSVRSIVDTSYSQPLLAYGDATAGGVVFNCLSGDDFTPRSLCGYRGGEPSAALLMPQLFDYGQFESIGSVGNVALFFVGASFNNASAGLWRSDGTTPGTFRISPDLRKHPQASKVHAIALGGRLLFEACHASGTPCGVYSSDANLTTPLLLADLTGTALGEFAYVGGKVAFRSGSSSSPDQLWTSDGTATGTDLLRSFSGRGIWTLASVGQRLHFVVGPPSPGNLPADYFVTDGSKGGTYQVPLPAQLRPMGSIWSPTMMAVDDDTVAFPCFRADVGSELCLADGDGSGIRLVADIYPGSTGSNPAFVGKAGDVLYLSADDGYRGAELWQLRPRGDRIFSDRFE